LAFQDAPVDHLTRRRIEAQVLKPLIRLLEERLGREEARRILSPALNSISREDGRALAERLGRNDLKAFREHVLPMWSGSGHMDLEVLESAPGTLEFDVTRCDYLVLYRELGLEDYAEVLSCDRDWAFLEGFNPDLRLRRDETLARGDGCCAFRYTSDR